MGRDWKKNEFYEEGAFQAKGTVYAKALGSSKQSFIGLLSGPLA